MAGAGGRNSGGVNLPPMKARYTPAPIPNIVPPPINRFGFRGSADTPLGNYASHRRNTHLNLNLLRQRHLVSPGWTPQAPVAVATTVRPGATGQSFNSTTKFKCLPIPHAFTPRHPTLHATKMVSMHSPRYTPSAQQTTTRLNPLNMTSNPHVVSYSLISPPNSLRDLPSQRLIQRQNSVRDSRQKSCEVLPHRVHLGCYMTGEPLQLSDKQEITPEEIHQYKGIALSQNPALFYGKGIKSGGGYTTPKQVVKFENMLKEAAMEAKEVEEMCGRDSASPLELGRYSRLNRTITPGSPILEEQLLQSPPLSPLSPSPPPPS